MVSEIHKVSKNTVPNEPLVYVLILNYCSAEDVRKCVAAIEKSSYSNLKIVIIDNASPDSSGEVLRKAFPAHFFVQTGKNLGYVGGNNVGVRLALKAGADYVCVINPDVIVGHGTIKKLVSVMETNSMIQISAPVVEWNMRNQTVFVCGNLSRTKAIHVQYEQSAVEVDWLNGCFLLIRGDVFYKVGLFREDFFLECEDVEFCMRCRDHNMILVGCMGEVIQHNWSQFRLEHRERSQLAQGGLILFGRMRNDWRVLFLGIKNALWIRETAKLLRAFHFIEALAYLCSSLRNICRHLVQPIGEIAFPEPAGKELAVE